MKKTLTKCVALMLMLLTLAFSGTVFAAPLAEGRACCRRQNASALEEGQGQYFSPCGNRVFFQRRGLGFSQDGYASFGRFCWFIDADGQAQRANGLPVYCQNGNRVNMAEGNLLPCCMALL